MSKVGERIKHYRDQRNWTQLDLAKRLGIDNTVLSKIEKGKRAVEDTLLDKIADIFDVTTDELLGRNSKPRKENPNLFFFDMDGLNEDEIEDIKRHINYVKWKAKEDRGE